MLLKLRLLDKRRWPSGRRSLNFCLRVQSNSLPRSGTPSYPRGRVLLFVFNMLLKLRLLDKRTLRNKQCLLYAKLGCARLQLQANSHYTRWHELCDDENSCKWEQNVNLFIFCRVQLNLVTFKALAFLRSAELARSIQLAEDGGVWKHCLFTKLPIKL